MWEPTAPSHFVTPWGTLLLNQFVNGQAYMVIQEQSSALRTLRVTKDQVPQGDGAILHRRFTDGTEIRFTIEFWEDNGAKQACEETAREMCEELLRHLNSILNGDGRFYWQPNGYTDLRLLDSLRWFVELTTDWSDAFPQVKFGVDSPFPYFIDSTENSIAVADGATVVITNTGNADHYPVIIADGPTADFTLTNNTTGLTIAYDSGQPGAIPIGATDIGEFNTFKQTAYLGIGGPPGDDTNLKPGVLPLLTDYFALIPGANSITADGADFTVLQNNAWVPA